jgi:hypothetical protein
VNLNFKLGIVECSVRGRQEEARGDKKKLNGRWRLEDRGVELLEDRGVELLERRSSLAVATRLKIRRKDQTNIIFVTG